MIYSPAPSQTVRELQLVEKVCFFKKSACSQSLSPNPFPVGRGYFAGATAPRPCRGLRPCDPIFIKYKGLSTFWAPSQTVRELFCHPSRTAYPLRKNINIHIDLNFTFRYYFPYPVLILSVKSVTAPS